jgi:hypothetical protein
MKKDYFEDKQHYYIVEGEQIPASETTFIDISEDYLGYDVYEFEYKGKVYSSRCIFR